MSNFVGIIFSVDSIHFVSHEGNSLSGGINKIGVFLDVNVINRVLISRNLCCFFERNSFESPRVRQSSSGFGLAQKQFLLHLRVNVRVQLIFLTHHVNVCAPCSVLPVPRVMIICIKISCVNTLECGTRSKRRERRSVMTSFEVSRCDGAGLLLVAGQTKESPTSTDNAEPNVEELIEEFVEYVEIVDDGIDDFDDDDDDDDFLERSSAVSFAFFFFLCVCFSSQVLK